ncbi:ArsR family transcriptional regulator [Mycolicibacterium novocastrense]|uniref:ArsR/SmtB family transcription factor n=1 Tax=Mycolicibacterium novocastrense TaxID=59813 RepID=UPI000746FDA7|nr:metalloregulator ArsR/SmtB family transcription factor [Mycolicibacterium novocastrense]KUH69445.1 ArsR family transcriptional regulator [Mycolicibacterium novocastrense]KUH72962.1 ArsR family transcriptional regulator [Mycolicibacterium novocastrense]KUH74838.1 ArsR family transcriptional regulator [Mycolicibacterium novocastrense]
MSTSTADAPVSSLFNALGDPNRLRIVTRLCDGGPCSTSEVAEVIPVSRQATTKHLLLLESAGLVSSHRSGRERIWRMRPAPLADASEYLSKLSQRWDRALDRLRAHVEDH